MKTIYAIYARRADEKNWSSWCQVGDIDKAFGHAENIRRAGYKAKIYSFVEKKTILEDN
jgi:hypothetical protein